MTKRECYIEVLLRNGLNLHKKDALFISIQISQSDFASEIEKKAREFGLEDIFIFYNDSKNKNNKLSEYIEKDAKFLFFTSENTQSLNMAMVSDLINNDIGIQYTVAVLPNQNIISEEELYYYSSISDKDAVINWNRKISDNNKIVSQIKNFDLKMLKIENLIDTNLTMHFSGKIIGNSEFNRMKLFPNYKVELIPNTESVKGFVKATSAIVVGTEIVEELSLYIDNGAVKEYDCTAGNKAVKEILNPSYSPVVEAIGLIDKEAPTYRKYDGYNNIVLDRTSNPYILISSYDEKNDDKKRLVVPIGSVSLKVVGYNEKGKCIPLYEEEGFSKKIVPNKK